MADKLVAYYRVSTKIQGQSGLGIEAQRSAVMDFARQNSYQVIREYTEVETGTKHDLTNRPMLRKAIADAKRSKALLVVARLDRLLRSTVVCSMLKLNGVRFVACDNPYANELTIDILAAVYANESRDISARTKAALAAYKARGGKLGASLPRCRNLNRTARLRGAATAGLSARRAAKEAYADILPDVVGLAREGSSLVQIAKTLNEAGHTTRRGNLWNPMQVRRLLDMEARIAAATGGS